jgi:hypothetical protein
VTLPVARDYDPEPGPAAPASLPVGLDASTRGAPKL